MAQSAKSLEIYQKWCAGTSLRKLAAEYKLSYCRVQEICERARRKTEAPRELYRDRQRELLDKAIEANLPGVEAGNRHAIELHRRLIETSMRLEGTQPARKVELSGAGGEPLFTPDDQRRALTPEAIAALQAFEQTIESRAELNGHSEN